MDQAVRQAARSVAPLQDQLAQQIARAVILHVDETPWPARAWVLWLWVFCCSHTVLYVIGRRTKEMFDNTLSVDFVGRLTSDGYIVYRCWLLRPRCWAHLQRKLRGLAESSDRHTAQAGIAILDSFDRLMAAILEARERLAQPPPGQADPPAALPLTNNGAERQLRHYGKSAPHQLRHPHARGLQQHGAAGQRHRHLPPARGPSATALMARAIHAARTQPATPRGASAVAPRSGRGLMEGRSKRLPVNTYSTGLERIMQGDSG
jgi:hypothetical protein